MERLTKNRLKEIARSYGLSGYSRLNKSELISFISLYQAGSRPSTAQRPPPPAYDVLPSYESIKDDLPPNYFKNLLTIVKFVETTYPTKKQLADLKALGDDMLNDKMLTLDFIVQRAVVLVKEKFRQEDLLFLFAIIPQIYNVIEHYYKNLITLERKKTLLSGIVYTPAFLNAGKGLREGGWTEATLKAKIRKHREIGDWTSAFFGRIHYYI